MGVGNDPEFGHCRPRAATAGRDSGKPFILSPRVNQLLRNFVTGRCVVTNR